MNFSPDFHTRQLLHRAQAVATTGGSSAAWGSITGDIDNQTELQEFLDDLEVLNLLAEE